MTRYDLNYVKIELYNKTRNIKTDDIIHGNSFMELIRAILTYKIPRGYEVQRIVLDREITLF